MVSVHVFTDSSPPAQNLERARRFIESRMTVGTKLTLADAYEHLIHVGYAVIVETE